MAESEKVDLVKAIKGPTTGVFWIKTLMYGLAFSALLFIGFGIYKGYFAKPKPTQDITVGQGGQVVIRNEANKRHLIFFAEPYIGISTEDNADVGIRTGCRWEF